MKNILFFVLILSSHFVLAQIVSQPIVEFEGFDETKAILLDVRTPEEYAAGCINGALNMNWLSSEFNQKVASLDKTKKIYVYCKKGGRSLKSQARLLELGFKNVVDLEGGYDAYLAKK
ncbi:rhodanese-related sulfurtransferase [Maribacter spongiicola]|uniref:Rhodanese-related sulfurtransferase n=1 Tax=Maribacter spongiicola TaxID=1206753 RepID=A0A4V3ERR4_9FLAO|nr:rhodanese-like domain-containing protein [Maribacter spongiicola]TDT46973.1 rhodanese-related sulfurtransferase [Maribacter spongiicola]